MTGEKMRGRKTKHREVALRIDWAQTPRLFELLDGTQVFAEIVEYPSAERTDVNGIWMQGKCPVRQFKRLLEADAESRVGPGRDSKNSRVLRIGADRSASEIACLGRTRLFVCDPSIQSHPNETFRKGSQGICVGSVERDRHAQQSFGF